MKYGSKPVDAGNLILTPAEREVVLQSEPDLDKYIKPLISAKEYLNGQKRWCFWLKELQPNDLGKSSILMDRVLLVKSFRLASSKKPTREASNWPTLFAELRQPTSEFIFFPLTTSENRNYIPLEYFSEDNIVNNSCSVITNVSKYQFGILGSIMHMAWTKYTCGRLENRFRYSNKLVYNNFPWPKEPLEKNKIIVEAKAQKVLDVREEFEGSSLADLYDPLTMPPKLVKAHQELDRAVDLCYRPQAFATEAARIEYLFELYNQYTMPIIKEDKKTKNKKMPI